MPYQDRKYQKGDSITRPDLAVVHILGDGWVYHNNKLTHPAWAEHWSIAFLRQNIRAGQIFYAVPVVQP